MPTGILVDLDNSTPALRTLLSEFTSSTGTIENPQNSICVPEPIRVWRPPRFRESRCISSPPFLPALPLLEREFFGTKMLSTKSVLVGCVLLLSNYASATRDITAARFNFDTGKVELQYPDGNDVQKREAYQDYGYGCRLSSFLYELIGTKHCQTMIIWSTFCVPRSNGSSANRISTCDLP